MIAEVRSYLKTQIAAVDPDMKEHGKPFYNGDIGETIIEDYYVIQLNNFVNNLRSDYREDALSCLISIFGFGYSDDVSRYDTLFDKAICIRNEIISLRNFTGQNLITNIEGISIDSQQIGNNEDGFQFDINMTLSLAYLMEE